MPALELKLPPVALVLILALLMALLPPGPAAASLLPPTLRLPLAVLLLAAGIAIALAGVQAFRRARTTVNPMHPEASSALVSGGIYRHTRNPMYLGMLLALAAWAVWLGGLAPWLGLPAFVLYMNRFQIAAEERALEARFGADFAGYRRRVRRWL
ncbi:methyltransferase family protein [Caldimonas tepidiphila]|uniref:methyltransferase family protein n=1 Tax=Caldimonas tepidiphila TaxID=2315841 RepID=UPI000E5B8C0D|nr:isoprenylcysteine carboxylmethyltransferase family protein [Caldimonas tepidiphila]